MRAILSAFHFMKKEMTFAIEKMSKKIIILNGSPRKKGNTSSITAEFIKGAREAGNEVDEFMLSSMKINGCIGCWKGGKNIEHPCAQKDDMDKIYPKYI